MIAYACTCDQKMRDENPKFYDSYKSCSIIAFFRRYWRENRGFNDSNLLLRAAVCTVSNHTCGTFVSILSSLIYSKMHGENLFLSATSAREELSIRELHAL